MPRLSWKAASVFSISAPFPSWRASSASGSALRVRTSGSACAGPDAAATGATGFAATVGVDFATGSGFMSDFAAPPSVTNGFSPEVSPKLFALMLSMAERPVIRRASWVTGRALVAPLAIDVPAPVIRPRPRLNPSTRPPTATFPRASAPAPNFSIMSAFGAAAIMPRSDPAPMVFSNVLKFDIALPRPTFALSATFLPIDFQSVGAACPENMAFAPERKSPITPFALPRPSLTARPARWASPGWAGAG